MHCEEEVPVEVHSYVTAPLVFPKDPSYEGRTPDTHQPSLTGVTGTATTAHDHTAHNSH